MVRKKKKNIDSSTLKYDADNQTASFLEFETHEYNKDNASLIARFERISFKRKATSSFYVGKTKLERKKIVFSKLLIITRKFMI